MLLMYATIYHYSENEIKYTPIITTVNIPEIIKTTILSLKYEYKNNSIENAKTTNPN